MPRSLRFRLGLASIAAVVAGGGVMAGAPGEKPALTCFDFPRTFEQRIADDHAGADAVFAGEVSDLTVSTATLRVLRRWKGNLAAEVRISTGVTDLGDGVIRVQSERFEFARGEKYVLFANGKAVDGKPFDTLDTSVCVRNVKLTEADRTIAVLDAIAQATATVDAVVDCVTAGTCRGMKAGSLDWFDQVGIPVLELRDGESVFALRLAPKEREVSIWITPPGERRPHRLVVVDGAGRAIGGELGPQPGDRNPQLRMTSDQLDGWRKAHRAFSFRPRRVPITGEEYRTYWQEEADRALAAIRRQLAAKVEGGASARAQRRP